MLKKSKWLLKEAKLRLTYMTNKDCIFCKIVSGEIKKEFLTETDKVVAFPDINPVAAVHILIVPKKHIESVLTVTADDAEILVDMYKVVSTLVEQNKLDAFRVAYNGGRLQHVSHLHMHLLSGGKVEWSKL